VPAAVSGHLLQVLTEGLSNTARHAHATSVEAIVDVESGSLKFSLLDDGVGGGRPSYSWRGSAEHLAPGHQPRGLLHGLTTRAERDDNRVDRPA
jgi:anti-sigma regulatory factor (Ser/Thr protein kinase)